MNTHHLTPELPRPSCITLLSLELYKLKRQRLIIAVVLLLAIEFLLLRFSIVRSLSTTTDGRLVIFDLAFYNTMFLPMLCTVIASTIIDIERSGHMLTNLLTIMGRSQLYWIKLIISTLLLACIVCIHALISYFIAGHYFSPNPFTLPQLAFYALSTFAVSLLILLIVQMITLISSSQFIANISGALLTLLGLFGILIPPGFSRFIPSAYYALCSPVGIGFSEHGAVYQTLPWAWFELSIVIVAIVVLSVVSIRYASTREELS